MTFLNRKIIDDIRGVIEAEGQLMAMIEESVSPLANSISELTKAVTSLVAQNQKPAQTLPSMAELFQFQMMKLV